MCIRDSYLGVVLARQGDLQGAVEANLEAIDLAPTDLVTLRNLTLLYRDLNQPEVAVEWGLRALASAGGDTATEMQMRQVVGQRHRRGIVVTGVVDNFQLHVHTR